jgi:hypothetical protein
MKVPPRDEPAVGTAPELVGERLARLDRFRVTSGTPSVAFGTAIPC